MYGSQIQTYSRPFVKYCKIRKKKKENNIL